MARVSERAMYHKGVFEKLSWKEGEKTQRPALRPGALPILPSGGTVRAV